MPVGASDREPAGTSLCRHTSGLGIPVYRVRSAYGVRSRPDENIGKPEHHAATAEVASHDRTFGPFIQKTQSISVLPGESIPTHRSSHTSRPSPSRCPKTHHSSMTQGACPILYTADNPCPMCADERGKRLEMHRPPPAPSPARRFNKLEIHGRPYAPPPKLKHANNMYIHIRICASRKPQAAARLQRPGTATARGPSPFAASSAAPG